MAIKLTKEQALNILDDDSCHVLDEQAGRRRWSEDRHLIFRHEGKLLGFHYSRGLTEQQDEGPFEYVDEVEAHEYEEYERKVTSYRRVQEPAK